MNSFKGIKPGDRIRFRGAVGGCVQRRHVALVNPLLIFEDHVVVDHGIDGTVVDGRNFLCIEKAAVPASS